MFNPSQKLDEGIACAGEKGRTPTGPSPYFETSGPAGWLPWETFSWMRRSNITMPDIP